MATEPQPEPVEPKWDAADSSGSFLRYAEFIHQKAKRVFLNDQTHADMVFIFKERGECLLTLVRGDRDEFVRRLKDMIRGSDVVGVVHVAEAWFRMGGTGDHITTQIQCGELRVSDLRPEDRGEALMVTMHPRVGRATSWVEPIVRDANGKPSLGEGFTITETGGRFAGLFG